MSKQIKFFATLLLLVCAFFANASSVPFVGKPVEYSAPNAFRFKLVIEWGAKSQTINVDATYTGTTPPPAELHVKAEYKSDTKQLLLKYAEYEEIQMIKSIAFPSWVMAYNSQTTFSVAAQTIQMPKPTGNQIVIIIPIIIRTGG